eukprot:gene12950-biopygen5718
MMGSFYSTIGCTISYDKSWWMTINGVRPDDIGHLRAVAKGGWLRYLGFLIHDDGTLTPGRRVVDTFRDAAALLPGGQISVGLGGCVVRP